MSTAPARKPEPMACAVCGHHEADLSYPVRDLIQPKDGHWWFVTCKSCGHGYLSPHPTEDELSELYKALWSPEGLQLANNVGRSGFEQSLTRSRLGGIRAVLGDHPVERLLDVGCGLGFFLRALHEAWPKAEALGVELVDQAASRAERPGVDVLRQPWEQVQLPEAGFDIVTLIHFLEHQTTPGIDIDKAGRLLRSGGALVVEVPRLDGWGRRLFGRWYWPHLPPQHLQVFSRRGLTRLLEDRGFDVDHVHCRTGYPLQATTTLVLFSRFTFGTQSRFADNWWVRGPLVTIGLMFLPLVFLFDLLIAPLLNLMGLGDILLVVGKKR